MNSLRLLLALALLSPALTPRAHAVAVRAVPRGPSGPSTVNFNVTPAQIAARYQAAQTQMQASLQTILAVPAAQRDFGNTVAALEDASSKLSEDINQLVFMASVHPDEAIRAAAQAVEEDVSKLSVGIWSREDLYQAVKVVADAKPDLKGEDAKLLEAMMDGFKSSGLGLSASERAKLGELREKLSSAENQFGNNLNKVFDGLELSREQLDGLPADYIDGLEKTSDGKYKVTLSYPDYLPFMKYAKDSELRRQLQLKYATRAEKENAPLLVEGLRLRREIAQTLGYASYPDMAIEGRMAETPAKVWSFLRRLWPMLADKGRKELDALLQVKRQDDPAAGRIEPWELSFYSNKLKQARYGFDPEEVKQYFPVDRVVDGTLQVYQQLLGVTFTEVKGAQTWHADVKLFEISDTKTGERIGHFYLDLFPRQGKYGHAAAFTIISGRELPAGYQSPVSAMVANFPKATPNQPALLPHGDVETFFHEFGHLMHQTLTKARYSTFSGSSVALDFVEAPSQMLENFVWNKKVLDIISGHWQDPSKKLPQELFDKMVAAKNYNSGLSYLGQLAFAMADMSLHAAVPADTSALFNTFLELVGLVPVQPGSKADLSFGHLMGGYGAGYYAYLWSEVYAHDIFSEFEKDGVLSAAVGERYRRTILEKGSSQPEMDTLKEFLGREPSEKAFLEQLQGPASLEDRFWALKRAASESREALAALEIDGVDFRLKDGKLTVRLILWPESMSTRSEADVVSAVKKVLPGTSDLDFEFTWLGVGA